MEPLPLSLQVSPKVPKIQPPNEFKLKIGDYIYKGIYHFIINYVRIAFFNV